MVGEERNVPDAVKDFAELLKEYGVKEPKAYTIAKYIGDTGQPDIFDDPEALLEKMIKWPKELSPLARATVLEHWGAQRGLNLSSFCSGMEAGRKNTLTTNIAEGLSACP